MTPVHEARFYEPLADKKVLCTLCPHDCRIPDRGRGACRVRYNRDGRLYTLVYDKVVAREVNPIEKKPFFHFHPGSYAYFISTVGCSLHCSYCENSQISQWPKDHLPKKLDQESNEDTPEAICPQLEALDAEVPGEPITPAEIVRAAQRTGCLSVSYTFTEPTIFYELAYDTAVLAREQGLKKQLCQQRLHRRGAPSKDRALARCDQHRSQVLPRGVLPAHQPRPAATGVGCHPALPRARGVGGSHHLGDPGPQRR